MNVLQGGVVSTSPNPQAGGPPFVGCPRLLIQFIRSYPLYRRSFLYPQPEDAPCHSDRDPLHMDTHEKRYNFVNVLKINHKFRLGKSKLCKFCARYEATEGGREGIVPLILNHGPGWRRVVSVVSWPLYPQHHWWSPEPVWKLRIREDLSPYFPLPCNWGLHSSEMLRSAD